VLLGPLGLAVLIGLAATAWARGATRPTALAMFCLAAFVVAAVARELWSAARARATLVGERTPASLVAVVRRNRRRYGGYAVHVGMAVLLVGVAASSSFGHVVDARLRPGQSARLGAYQVRYVRPWSDLSPERIALGTVLDISREGRHVATLTPSRDYYPSLDQAQLGRIGRFFNGEAESQIGLRAGLGRDVWTAAQPDLSAVQPALARANRRFSGANPALEGFLTSLIVRRWEAHATADFRLIDSPLVVWLWIGGVIMVGGAMLAAWPAPHARAARAAAPQLAWSAARRSRGTAP
jgi:cytochrome c-type biogenesis protein CcmF